MNDHASGFVHHQDIVILVEDDKRDHLGLGGCCDRFARQRDNDLVAGGQPLSGAGLKPVHGDGPFFDPALEGGTAMVRQTCGKPAIQALACGRLVCAQPDRGLYGVVRLHD